MNYRMLVGIFSIVFFAQIIEVSCANEENLNPEEPKIVNIFDEVSQRHRIFVFPDSHARVPATWVTYAQCEILLLETERLFQGRGYATLAMTRALKELEQCSEVRVLAYPTEVMTDHARLKSFYRKFGFQPDCRESLINRFVQWCIGHETNFMVRKRDRL